MTRGFVCPVVGAMFHVALSAHGADSLRFEGADIHPSVPGTNIRDSFMQGQFIGGGRFEMRKATMVDLGRLGWSVQQDKVIGGPTGRPAADASWPIVSTLKSTNSVATGLPVSSRTIAASSRRRVLPGGVFRSPVRFMPRLPLSDRARGREFAKTDFLPFAGRHSPRKPTRSLTTKMGQLGCWSILPSPTSRLTRSRVRRLPATPAADRMPG
jgi:hypothetical protein